MINYHLRCHRTAEQLLELTLSMDVPTGTHRFLLPHWRPGRYELQQYARYLGDLVAEDQMGNRLPIDKVETHAWDVTVETPCTLRLHYVFYANQTDAGGSYLDSQHLMVNGINLFLYPEGGEASPCRLQIELPEGFSISGGLEQADGWYQFESFHQLVDSPFLAGRHLQHHDFQVGEVPIHLWFLGACQPNFARLQRDIEAYSKTQLAFFGTYPVQDYHYLYFMLPHRYRHGVEHHRSTVIVMGPGRDAMQPEMYRSLLEISSHEFFHTWNVKALRPADMWPYAYRQENYSKLHYITEGVTTYYGDLMLWKSGVWELDQWLSSMNGELARHYQMGGKDFVSLSEASFDSWVNGYHREGIPNRRISFYTKGYLMCLLLDAEIRQSTNHQASLDTVISTLYHRVTGEGRGYTREDLMEILQAQTGQSFEAFFADYVEGITALEPALQRLATYYGFQLIQVPAKSPSEAQWGIQTTQGAQGSLRLSNLYPDSPLLAAGLMAGDELVAIEGRRIQEDLDAWLDYFSGQADVTLHYFQKGQLHESRIPTRTAYQRLTPQFVQRADLSPDQQRNLLAWRSVQPQQAVAD